MQNPFMFGEWFDVAWFQSCYMTGVARTIHERLGYGLSQVVGELEGNVQRIYMSRSEWTELGERYLNDVLADPEKLTSVNRDLRKAADDLAAYSQELKKVDFSQCDAEELISYLDAYHKKHHPVFSLGQVPNLLELENTFLKDYLENWLKQQGLPDERVTEAFQTLATPRELSMAQREERDMLRLAQEKDPGEKLTQHWETYSWLHFGWTGPSLSREYFEQIHAGLYNEGNAKQLFENFIAQDEALTSEKKRWISETKMPADIVRLFRKLEELLYIKAHRMDALFLSYEASQPILQKIARDHFLSLGQLYALYPDWIIEMLRKGEFDIERINEIRKYSIQYFDGEDFYLLIGDQARSFAAPMVQQLPAVEQTNELKGEVAYPGKVTGPAKIVNMAKEMEKFKDGDVLISNVTDPTLLPIMKKAAAFVTNQGGLTCHAAIVARELRTPCVIGTKIATKVLKDGDLVEVDADNGIVRKL